MADQPLAAVLRRLRKWVGSGTGVDASDGQLLERFATLQDEAAFEILLQRHGPLVLSVCRRLLADDNDIDDAFQATFAVLVRRAAGLRREGSLGSWLYGVAYRIALKARSSAGRRRAREGQAMTNEPLAAVAEHDPPRQATRRELAAVLDEEMNRLPEKYRAPLILCYLEGKTSEQAARELGCPVGSMSWRLEKGRELLRGRLGQRGLALSAAGLLAALGDNAACAAVPPGLAHATAASAVQLALGQASTAVLSAHAASFVDEVLRGFVVARLRFAAQLLVVLTLAGGAAVYGYTRWHKEPAQPGVADWLADRVTELQPTADERKIDRIGWAPSIMDAQRLGRESGRPVFVFTHQGDIRTGRCGGSAFNLRAHALADERVIALLNSRFVPVLFDHTAPASVEEKAARERIFHEAFAARMTTGDDCIYLLTPDGKPLDSLNIRTARQADQLVQRLEQAAAKAAAPNGPPVVAPRPLSVPPTAGPDDLVLHLTARSARRDAWCEFPAENWIVIGRTQWSAFTPAPMMAAGDSWVVPAAAAAPVLLCCYPQTENNDVNGNRIESQLLRAVVENITDGVVRVRLEGSLRMHHDFYADRPASDYIDARLLGSLDFDLPTQRIRSLRLVTTHATYGPHQFAVAVRSVP